MILIFIIFLVLFAMVALINLYVRFNRSGRMMDRLPGPYAYPIFGNILDLASNEESLFTRLRELNAKYYPIYRFWNMHVAAVNILHPDDAEVILSSSKHIDKSTVYKYLQPWLSTGLLTSTGAKWHKRRKTLTPAFHFNILTQFVNIFIEESQYLVKTLKKEGNGGPIVKDLMELIGEHTLNAICETAMGISIRSRSSIHIEYRNAVKEATKLIPFRILTSEMLEILERKTFYKADSPNMIRQTVEPIKASIRPWYGFDFIFELSPNGRKQTKLLKILHGFTENIIAERKRYHESTDRKYLQNFDKMDEKSATSDTKSDDDNISMSKKRLAMLDLLISASLEDNQIDDKGIREEVDTFTFEGHDTTAMALCFALLLFAKHKDVQERIREEVNEVMLEKDNKLTIPVLQKLSYLERCLKESLRLYPSVPFISRFLKHDCQLNKYTIPAGAVCHIYIYEIHRDPAFWPNPLVFDPDRFLPENMKGSHPYSYIPFSAGLRNCIGQKFAMLEMKLMVAFILHNFALEPVTELDDVQMVMDLILRPAHPLPLKFIPLR